MGEPLTLASLRQVDAARWTPRRKAEVVAAVAGGLLTFDEACERYSLSIEELTGWQRAVDRSGMPGLRVTRIQDYATLPAPLCRLRRARIPQAAVATD